MSHNLTESHLEELLSSPKRISPKRMLVEVQFEE